LEVGVFVIRVEAGAFPVGTEVVVTDDQRTGVTAVQVFQQLSQGEFLRRCARVGGLPAGIKSPFVAYADGMGIVMMPLHQAVGAYHPLRTAWLDLSVTTDDVVVADTELIMSLLTMVPVDLSHRGRLVGRYCRTMDN